MGTIIVKPNVYVLGSRPELDLEFKDQSGVTFEPALIRLSVKYPDGTIVTVSGGTASTDTSLTVLSGFIYSYLCSPPTKGWYEYEAWGADGSDREIAMTNGFEVIDRVY